MNNLKFDALKSVLITKDDEINNLTSELAYLKKENKRLRRIENHAESLLKFLAFQDRFDFDLDFRHDEVYEDLCLGLARALAEHESDKENKKEE